MEISKEHSRSHLFLLRLWSEDEGNQRGDWNARLQHVFSGETHTFRACPQLVDVLMELSGDPCDPCDPCDPGNEQEEESGRN